MPLAPRRTCHFTGGSGESTALAGTGRPCTNRISVQLLSSTDSGSAVGSEAP